MTLVFITIYIYICNEIFEMSITVVDVLEFIVNTVSVLSFEIVEDWTRPPLPGFILRNY